MAYTTEEIDSLFLQIVESQKIVDEIDAAYKNASEKLNVEKTKMLAILQEIDKDKYSVKGYGSISIVNKFTVRLPSPENKEKFFNYLKKKDIFEKMITVHSATLNSWYNEEMRAALERGDVDFRVDGIEEPKLVQTIRFNKER